MTSGWILNPEPAKPRCKPVQECSPVFTADGAETQARTGLPERVRHFPDDVEYVGEERRGFPQVEGGMTAL